MTVSVSWRLVAVHALPQVATTRMETSYFKGCIRDLVMNGTRTSWHDMHNILDVHVSACPVSLPWWRQRLPSQSAVMTKARPTSLVCCVWRQCLRHQTSVASVAAVSACHDVNADLVNLPWRQSSTYRLQSARGYISCWNSMTIVVMPPLWTTLCMLSIKTFKIIFRC